MESREACPNTDANDKHALFGLPDKGVAVKELVVCKTFGCVVMHSLSEIWFMLLIYAILKGKRYISVLYNLLHFTKTFEYKCKRYVFNVGKID